MLLGLMGCLPSDPGSDPTRQEAEKDISTGVLQPNTSPASLADHILKNRNFSESPLFASQVAEGVLPPVADRLPKNPLVVRPLKMIGRYGGTLRRALTGDIVQTAGVSKALGEDLMSFVRPMPTGIVYSLAENHTYEDEGRVAIFKIREGVKWSDGHPLTVDDILFWYYDLQLDENARDGALPPTVWVVDDKPIKMEKVDDTTLRIESPYPLGRVLNAFTGTGVALPKHFFKKWHPRYNPNADYQTWRDSTTAAMRLYRPGTPSLSAWMPVGWERGQRLIYERNPYYWKVDTAGNQLPYCDRLVFTVIQDHQVIMLKFMNGELDLFGRYSRIQMLETLKVGESSGRFKVGLSGPDSGPAFYLNWDAENLNLRKAFRDKRVRVALSHAINRQEISEIVYGGWLEPSGYSFGRSNPYFDLYSYKRYVSFDPDKANALLNEAGYVKRPDGFRIFQDGNIFEMTIDISGTGTSDVCELVKSHWEAVGIKVHLNISLRDIIWPRRVNGEFDIHHWGFEGPADPLGRLNDWAIMGDTVPFWHRNASKVGPKWLHEATRQVLNTLTTIDVDSARAYMDLARELHSDNVPVIVVGSAYSPWGVSARMGNVPDEVLLSDVYRGMRAMMHEQLYIKGN
ncbi:MAG: ABC transporter substrate-binding protein [Candidatus Latescibacterota bacterium]|nr:ABC transporter substrate-binding protein [Candidatus Latescibacterota bacterium]